LLSSLINRVQLLVSLLTSDLNFGE